MEKYTNSSESLGSFEEQVREKVDFAKANQVLDEDLNKEYELSLLEKRGDLTSQQTELLSHLREKIEKGTVLVSTLPEARIAMEMLGFDEESLVDVLSHENAHGNRASQLGADHVGYRFILVKTPGGVGVQPQTKIYIPDEWDIKTQNRVLAEITRAPEDYDNELSDEDKRDLERLENEK